MVAEATGHVHVLDGSSGEESNQGWQDICPDQPGE